MRLRAGSPRCCRRAKSSPRARGSQQPQISQGPKYLILKSMAISADETPFQQSADHHAPGRLAVAAKYTLPIITSLRFLSTTARGEANAGSCKRQLHSAAPVRATGTPVSLCSRYWRAIGWCRCMSCGRLCGRRPMRAGQPLPGVGVLAAPQPSTSNAGEGLLAGPPHWALAARVPSILSVVDRHLERTGLWTAVAGPAGVHPPSTKTWGHPPRFLDCSPHPPLPFCCCGTLLFLIL